MTEEIRECYLSARLLPGVKTELTAVAERLGTNRNQVLRQLIDQFLAQNRIN